MCIYLYITRYNRLDFEAFAIAGPNTQTVCATDNFRVSGTANKVPIICGQNVGQHSKLISVLSSCKVILNDVQFNSSVLDCPVVDG